MKRVRTTIVFFLTVIAVIFSACSSHTVGTSSRQLGEKCDNVDTCLDGLYCEDGICRKPCAINKDCDEGYHCQDQRCVIGGTSSCGNGVENTNEQCDDGNNVSGDGCSAVCNVEKNYECDGWPSHCVCKQGYQDSNHDGRCLPDCSECQEGQKCLYNTDGTAKGCGCTDGFQDSNSDGTCLPDCEQCGEHQSCQYNNDGTAKGCGCITGYQDSNNDGHCNPVCDCVSGEICSYDQEGLADCNSCSFKVAPDGGSDLETNSRDKPAKMEVVLEFINSQIAAGNVDHCTIEMAPGYYYPSSSWHLVNTSLIGTTDSDTTTTIGKLNGDTRDSGMIFASGKTSFKNIIITNGYSGNKYPPDPEYKCAGAAIVTVENEELIIDNCIFRNNTAGNYRDSQGCLGQGGAIAIDAGTAIISYSDFLNNNASDGGALHIQNNANVVIKNSNFSYNISQVTQGSTAHGGAIYLDGSSLSLEDCNFLYNSQNGLDGQGVGIYANKSRLSVKDSFFLNNLYTGYTSMSGGAIYSNDSRVTIEKSFFVENGTDLNLFSSYAKPVIRGGSIFAQGNNTSSLTISDCTFFESKIGNTWSPMAGGFPYFPEIYGIDIYNTVNNAHLENLRFMAKSVSIGWSNSTPKGSNIIHGGCIYNGGENVTMVNSIFNNIYFNEFTLDNEELKGALVYNKGTMQAGYITVQGVTTSNQDGFNPYQGVKTKYSSRAFFSEKENGLTIYNSIIFADAADGTNVIYHSSFNAPYDNYDLQSTTYTATKPLIISVDDNKQYATITVPETNLPDLGGMYLKVNNWQFSGDVTPIISNTGDTLIVLAVGELALNQTLSDNTAIEIVDMHNLADRTTGTTDFKGMARTNFGPQPTDNKDLNGHDRGQYPDIGAIQF